MFFQLFLDDSERNIAAGKALGLRTALVSIDSYYKRRVELNCHHHYLKLLQIRWMDLEESHVENCLFLYIILKMIGDKMIQFINLSCNINLQSPVNHLTLACPSNLVQKMTTLRILENIRSRALFANTIGYARLICFEFDLDPNFST